MPDKKITPKIGKSRTHSTFYIEIIERLKDNAGISEIKDSLKAITFEDKGFYFARRNNDFDGICDYIVFLDEGTYASSVPLKDAAEFEILIQGLYIFQTLQKGDITRVIGQNKENGAPNILTKKDIETRLNELCGDPLGIFGQAESGRGFTIYSPRPNDAKLVKQYFR
ncbi:hypothetical protein HYU09_05420 [Candidatus Woesearchaeota archaeon]|nr:hypothetical protein [Candidatus Woesearchaeota archaeon]